MFRGAEDNNYKLSLSCFFQYGPTLATCMERFPDANSSRTIQERLQVSLLSLFVTYYEWGWNKKRIEPILKWLIAPPHSLVIDDEIHSALRRGYPGMIRALVSMGAQRDKPRGGYTALDDALRFNWNGAVNDSFILVLIDCGFKCLAWKQRFPTYIKDFHFRKSALRKQCIVLLGVWRRKNVELFLRNLDRGTVGLVVNELWASRFWDSCVSSNFNKRTKK